MDMNAWAALITALGTLLTAFLAGVAAVLAALAKAKGEQNASTLAAQDKVLAAVSDKVEVVHTATNGLTAALVTAREAAATAEGHEAGRLQGKAEAKADSVIVPPNPATGKGPQ